MWKGASEFSGLFLLVYLITNIWKGKVVLATDKDSYSVLPDLLNL